MMFKNQKSLLKVVLFLTVIAFAFSSCDKDDDKSSCSNYDDLYEDYEDAYDDMYSAYLDGDCDEVEEKADELLDLVNSVKGCAEFQEEIDDAGYDDVDEFMDEFEESLEFFQDNC